MLILTHGFLALVSPIVFKSETMRIVDAIPYNGEPVCDVRLAYLKDVIDHFYIFESSVAQNGIKKKLYGTELLSRHPDLADKIIYVHADDFIDFEAYDQSLIDYIKSEKTPQTNEIFRQSALARENKLRCFMHDYLKDHLNKDDLLFFTDADEIPTHDAVEYVRKHAYDLPYPLYILGDCIQSSVRSHASHQKMFWYESFFIPADQLSSCEPLSHIRFRHHFNANMGQGKISKNFIPMEENLLLATRDGIGLKVYNHVISRYKRIEDELTYVPLMFHLRDFMTLTGKYKKNLHSSFYIKADFDVDSFANYLFADFENFKRNAILMFYQNKMDRLYDYPHFKKIMPESLYQFGYDLAEKNTSIPDDDIFMQDYKDLYLPFQKELYDILSKEQDLSEDILKLMQDRPPLSD
ncbi:MAG: hypothetical protein AAF621_07535 [Pseudomonadota bacterium]